MPLGLGVLADDVELLDLLLLFTLEDALTTARQDYEDHPYPPLHLYHEQFVCALAEFLAAPCHLTAETAWG